jgi:tRNA-dihydrouridine synthase
MFTGRAEWDWIGRVRQAVSIPIIGNGDVRSPQGVAEMFEQTGCDAVMIGRAAIGNPWIFSRTKAYLRTGIDPGPPTLGERIEVYFEHLEETIAEKGERRAILEGRKHLSRMLRGFSHISPLRAAVLGETTLDGVRHRLEPLLSVGSIGEACA